MEYSVTPAKIAAAPKYDRIRPQVGFASLYLLPSFGDPGLGLMFPTKRIEHIRKARTLTQDEGYRTEVASLQIAQVIRKMQRGEGQGRPIGKHV
jgi:hypothetical protein